MTNENCGATTSDGGECDLAAGWGTDHVGEGRCRLHGGNAGAPEGNTNNIQHGKHADRGRFYEWLDGRRQRLVDRLERSLAEKYTDMFGEGALYEDDRRDFYELALDYASRDLMRERMAKDAEESGNPLLEHVEMEKNGDVIEFDKPHSLFDKITDSRRENRLTKKHKGLENDPDSKQAEAVDSLVTALSTDT